MSPVRHSDIVKRPRYFRAWEKYRNNTLHPFVECFAEALGVFFYVYGGVGATASTVLGNLAEKQILGSLLQIGFGYAFGILLAIAICSATSGGHFNPCITVVMVIFRNFPRTKALRYIFAQILGGYLACLLVFYQYADLIGQIERALEAKGLLEHIQFTPMGTGGILGIYMMPGGHIGRVFVNEFVTDIFLGLAIWACLDPSNVLIPPAAAPWAISFAYAAAIWGYAPIGLAANTARDVGGRLANITIYGMKAVGGPYAAVAALTNIVSMCCAVLIYEFFLTDCDRAIPNSQLEFQSVHKDHRRFGHSQHVDQHERNPEAATCCAA